MNVRISKTFLLLLCIFSEFNINKKQRFPTSKAFLIFKTNSLSGRSCTCSTSYSCSCCENVIIIYTKMTKQLCVNFIYETNALKVNITLNSIILTDQTITEYKSFRICNKVPGSFFSNVCANVLELNRFPRSITICLRTEIATKHKLWQLNYNCISISTELPMMSNMTTATTMTVTQSPGMSPGQMTGMPGMPGMPSGQMPGMPAMPSGQMPGMPAMPSGQMPGMPAMPSGQMPAMPAMPSGQMPGMPAMPSGQMPAMPAMPSGQMPAMPAMPSGQMPAMPAMPSGQMPGTPAMPPGQMMGMPPGQMMGMPPGQMMGMPPGQMMGMPGMTPGQMPPGQTMGMPGMSSG
ncbi:calcium-binding protein P-like isoform X1 [Vespula maculifrons]|uniref:Calcium-binding protein P-like isoform X1 n=1 Tax=Vespula maculifrons TaxID=7453 RepID=A0ABD2BB76_VESMC